MIPPPASLRAALGGLPRTFWMVWTGMLVNRLASFVAPFLALFLVRERGFDAAEAGRIVAVYGLGVMVAGPLGGTLADRLGRRPTMLLGLVTGALSVAALALTRDPLALGALAFVNGATGEIYRPAMNAVVADVVPPADRTRAYGLVYWAINMGWSVGLSVAGLFAERHLSWLFFLDATTSLAFAGVLAFTVPETRPADVEPAPALAGLAQVFRDRVFVVFMVLALGGLMVFTQFQLAAPLDMAAHGVGPSGFAWLMALNGVGVVVLQPLLGARLRRYEPSRALAASALLFGIGFGVNALGGSVPLYVLGVMLWTLGEVVGFPVANAVVADLSPAALRGRYQGAYSMSWGVAFTLSPLIGGEVMSRFGARTLWIGTLVLGAILAAGHLAAAPARRRRLAADRPVAQGGAALDRATAAQQG
ncbi:major facilitator superfamily MFS_1 [Anaeromyxobacter dehalogenans 2CP-1]|uniref:Major facilitator superfamily MFS_1 n=1 Tax=Anaeromyxobacter dehalogenans (strain ATCC BAA-258 / DSM 21875 / 2CP-1) TaxID=455488 RepID=B8JCK7_ANAD2|nr:MFS transporter [Anaeromyxobacter dehalogenans]ACL67727.1 major facilitator superfamily MFS_1 [Anaeromyxobacter dehalogenans 2CP-1]